MTIQVNVKDITVDDFDLLKSNIQNNESFELMFYDPNNEEDEDEKNIGIFFQNKDLSKGASTLMFDVSKKDAIILSKMLLTFCESI